MTLINPQDLNTIEDAPPEPTSPLRTSIATPEVVAEVKTETAAPPILERLITLYAEAAARHARYAQLDDGTWYGEVVGLDGVWAEGSSVPQVDTELVKVIESWVLLKLDLGQKDIPPMEGLSLDGF